MPCRRRLCALALLVHCLWGGCGRAALDAGLEPGGDAGGVLGPDAPASAPAGGPYEMCGDPVPCLDGLRAMQVGSTCFCQPKCGPGDRGANAPGCPRPSSGLADPVCNGTDWCEIPCTTFGDETQCPPGLACGVTGLGLRCETTRAAIDGYVHGNGDGVIDLGELYSACQTFADATCPLGPTGSGLVCRSAAECFCSASCLADDQCPAPPPGYGRPICLVNKSFPDNPGRCALTCDPSAADPHCPTILRCRAPVPGVTYPEIATCRGGIYHHGNGDDVIDPGEAYGPDLGSTGGCDIGLSWTSEDGGRCIGECERDDDCPQPPPGYRAPVCDFDGTCWLSCANPGSTSGCPDGLTCGDVNRLVAVPAPYVLGCK